MLQGDAALGILNLAGQHYDVPDLGSWYEKLGQWSDALQLYEEENRDRQGGHDNNYVGKLRCFHTLGEWEQLTTITSLSWPGCDRPM
jgi:serine/threonine-protein kinase mTOR